MKKQDILLFESLKNYCVDMTGSCKNSFFDNWYVKNGKTYNFIFKQNLFVTNIQFRELVDLIQLNVKKNRKNVQINFMNTKDFMSLVSRIIGTFISEQDLEFIRKNPTDEDGIKDKLEIICSNYRELFENTIIMDAYYSSCIVSVPWCLKLDLKQICFQSGYLHSCGENIYTRNMEKADYDSFANKLADYLETCEKK